jgi:hypothetical protein
MHIVSCTFTILQLDRTESTCTSYGILYDTMCMSNQSNPTDIRGDTTKMVNVQHMSHTRSAFLGVPF